MHRRETAVNEKHATEADKDAYRNRKYLREQNARSCKCHFFACLYIFEKYKSENFSLFKKLSLLNGLLTKDTYMEK